MKPSLSTRVLTVIEKSERPVETHTLVRMAEANGYKCPRAAVWKAIKMLRLNGYVKPAQTGRGSRPSVWVPTNRG